MGFDIRSRNVKTGLVLSSCMFTLILLLVLNRDDKTGTTLKSETLISEIHKFSDDSELTVDADQSEDDSELQDRVSELPERGSELPERGPPDSNSPNLKPPSQQWARAQFYKTMSFLGWEYTPPNDWEKCGARTYFFPKVNTMFTGTPKTGCSNWLIALLGAEGELDKNVNGQKVAWVHGGSSQRHRIQNMAEQYDRTVLDKAFSFTVVRNPWTRLVSGYRQKISSEETQGGEMKFARMKVLSEIRGITDHKLLEGLYPTFEEFVRFMVRRKGQYDRHFHPQTIELCIPYAMYDVIVPLEYSATLSQEVWSKINGSETSLLGSYDKASDPRLQSSALYAKKWLSEMDPEITDQFYNIYKGDFMLMNYSNFTHPDFPLPLHSHST